MPATSSSRPFRTTSISETIAVCLTTISAIGSIEAPQEGKSEGFQRALRGFQFGYIFTYASRLPFNVLLGQDRNFDSNNNDRPIGVGRNTGRGFDYASLDLRVSRRFKLTERVDLQLLAEGFNVLNRANLAVPINTLSAGARFGLPTQAFDPRQFQFGMKSPAK